MGSLKFLTMAFAVFVLRASAQDVDIPPNLLPLPKTTTAAGETEEIETTSVMNVATIPESLPESTTTKGSVETSTSKSDSKDDDETEKGSWIKTMPPLRRDKLVDATTHPIYTYPQITNSNPNFNYPNTNPTNCNNFDHNLPVIVPPIYNPVTDEPELEELRRCPIGFVQNHTECVPQHTVNCPIGYVWRDDRCVLSQVVCPINFDYDGTKCVERKICPPNHVWRDGKCEQPEPVCPPGWRWNGEKCVVASIQCQPGSLLINNECVIESVACPPGFSLVNGQCIEPPPICPPGFELQESGFCTQINKRCPPGSILINGQCQKTEIVCPPGTQKIGDHCYTIPSTTTTTTTTTTKSPALSPIITTTTTTKRPSSSSPSSINTEKPSSPTELPPTVTEEEPHVTPPPSSPNNKICPDEFVFYNGQCYKCPDGYSLCNGMCLKNVVQCGPYYPRPMPPRYPPPMPHYPPPNINININLSHPSYPARPPPSSGGNPYSIINNIEPINNTIYNINNVTHPVTLNNVNENNIYVYTGTRCADGTFRTTIIKNNETIVGCSDFADNGGNANDAEVSSTTQRTHEDGKHEEKCCEIVTPRQCKKRLTDQWICTHRRYKYCGKFCIADRLYLKPPATSWSNSVLTLQPSPNPTWITPCYGRDCPPVDCAGCMDGSFNCSPQCYTYPCSSNTCTFVDQDDFCENNNGEMCSK